MGIGSSPPNTCCAGVTAAAPDAGTVRMGMSLVMKMTRMKQQLAISRQLAIGTAKQDLSSSGAQMKAPILKETWENSF